VVEILNRHGVRYVVIGGWVAQAYVESYVTEDVDFTPATDPDNLERLSAALTELGARIRTEAVPEGLPFAHDAVSLGRTKMWNLQCRHGAFDIALEPAGGGYDHLASHAHLVNVRGSKSRWRTWPTSLHPRGSRTAQRSSWFCLNWTRL
jgi:hypothetical protein